MVGVLVIGSFDTKFEPAGSPPLFTKGVSSDEQFSRIQNKLEAPVENMVESGLAI